jgi:predicted DNA-binding ribbon-helix-helix protein
MHHQKNPARDARRSTLKRSVVVGSHNTSVSLEDAFWEALKTIAIARHTSVSCIIAAIDSTRQHTNLSSAIRLFVLDHYLARAEDINRDVVATPMHRGVRAIGHSSHDHADHALTRRII